MSFWLEVLNEIKNNNTIFLIIGFILTAILTSRLVHAEMRRVWGIGVMLILHLILIPFTAYFNVISSSSPLYIALLCQVFASLTAIWTIITLVFKILLPFLRIETPLILQDLMVAGSSLIAFFVLASKSGYNLSGLIATSAVITAVIGFSLQDTLVNIMGGLALQMDNSICVGDWIKLNDISGKVVEIRWRYTAIETRNWETLIIPNSVIMKNQVLVLGRKTNKPIQWRRWVYFNVDFRYSPSEVIKVVGDALKNAEVDKIATEPPINCILMDMQDSYCQYAVRYWLTDLIADDPTDSEVRTWVYFALKRADIPLSIPAQALFVTEESSDRKEEKNKVEIRQRVKALEKVELFGALSEAEREKLATNLRYAPFSQGEIITRQGSEAHWLYMIIKGSVSIQIANEGLECEVARLNEGHFVGEMSLLTGEKRSATVIAITDVICYRLDKEAFQEIIHARPDIAEHIAEILAKRKVELEAKKEGLDHEAHALKMAHHKNNFLTQIRDFFGLSDLAHL